MSYGPTSCFSHSIYGPGAKSAGPQIVREKKRGSVTYSMDRENEVIKKIFIISLLSV